MFSKDNAGRTAQLCKIAVAVAVLISGASASAEEIDPWADTVVSYAPGGSALEGYTTADNILGPPSRMTGDPAIWPYDPAAAKVAVTMVNGPWTPDDVVSITDDGHLTVSFNQPVTNDPLNPFGVDLIAFGNTSFFTADWPTNQQLMNPAQMSSKPGKIEVSSDGVTFYEIRRDAVGPAVNNDGGVDNVLGDSLFPSHAFASSAATPPPGTPEQNFLTPLDPDLDLTDFDGLSVAEALELYGDSAGGAGIDLDWAVDADGVPVDLDEVSYVRITSDSLSLDALADVQAVPEPATFVLLTAGVGVLGLARRRRKR